MSLRLVVVEMILVPIEMKNGARQGGMRPSVRPFHCGRFILASSSIVVACQTGLLRWNDYRFGTRTRVRICFLEAIHRKPAVPVCLIRDMPPNVSKPKKNKAKKTSKNEESFIITIGGHSGRCQ
jgi:hypothetical protein